MIEHAEQIRERVDFLMKSAGYDHGHTVVERGKDGGVMVSYVEYSSGPAVRVGCNERAARNTTWEEFAAFCFRSFVRSTA